MVGCVSSQLKPSELYILSFEKILGLRPRPFSKLRMYSCSGFTDKVIVCWVSPVCHSFTDVMVSEGRSQCVVERECGALVEHLTVSAVMYETR